MRYFILIYIIMVNYQISNGGYYYKIYKNGSKKRISQNEFYQKNTNQVGGSGGWYSYGQGDGQFRSYKNNSFNGTHCTIWESGDKHCKKSGNTYGTVKGNFKTEGSAILKNAYMDFIQYF